MKLVEAMINYSGTPIIRYWEQLVSKYPVWKSNARITAAAVANSLAMPNGVPITIDDVT